MSKAGEYGNPLQKFKLVFLGEQSGKYLWLSSIRLSLKFDFFVSSMYNMYITVANRKKSHKQIPFFLEKNSGFISSFSSSFPVLSV